MAHICFADLPGSSRDAIVSLKERGHYVSLITGNLNAYLTSTSFRDSSLALLDDIHIKRLVSDLDSELFLRKLEKKRPIDLLYSTLDPNLPDITYLCSILNKPALDWRVAATLRNKYRVRQRLQDAGLSQPNFHLVLSSHDLWLAVDALGYPCVLKPVDGFGSIGVSILRSPECVSKVIAEIGPLRLTGSRESSGVFMLESFLVGPEISIETIFRDGANVCYATTNKYYNRPDSAVEFGGMCYPPCEAGFSEAISLVQEALDIIGFDFGFAHTEVILTKGGPQIVEINPRMIGGAMAPLLEIVVGSSPFVDFVETLVGSAGSTPFMDYVDTLGNHKESGPDDYDVCGIRWITAPRDGILKRIHFPPKNEWLVRSEAIVDEGAAVCLPRKNNDRVGFLVARGSSDADVKQRLALAEADVEIEVTGND